MSLHRIHHHLTRKRQQLRDEIEQHECPQCDDAYNPRTTTFGPCALGWSQLERRRALWDADDIVSLYKEQDPMPKRLKEIIDQEQERKR